MARAHRKRPATTSTRQSTLKKRKHAYFEALDANVPVIQDQDESGRTKITDAVYQWFAELQLFQGKDQQGKSEKTLRAYNYRLGFFLDFTVQNNLRYLDQVDRKQLLRYVKSLRDHESDLDDRTVHNVFETLNTFLRTRDIFIAGKILAELDYAEKAPKPYTKQELKDMFAAMDDERTALRSVLEFWRARRRDAEHRVRRLQLGKGHAARSAEAVAPFSSEGQEEKEVRQGQILFRSQRSWSGKSRTE